MREYKVIVEFGFLNVHGRKEWDVIESFDNKDDAIAWMNECNGYGHRRVVTTEEYNKLLKSQPHN